MTSEQQAGCEGGRSSPPPSGDEAGARGAELEDRALRRQGTQHSFQEAKAQNPSKPRPHSASTARRKLKEKSDRAPHQGREHNMDRQMARAARGKDKHNHHVNTKC